MKRGSEAFVFSFIVFLLISISLVSAASIGADLASGIDEFTKAIEPFAKNILGETPSGQYLFAQVLFFLIILAIVWTALDKADFFNEHPWVLWIVSLAASILSTRWLASEALINTIILPYTTLGIAISAGLPFVLYFLLVNVSLRSQPPIIRRLAWIFFAVIFIGLWISRREAMTTGSYAGYIYPVTAIVAFIMAMMDGTIEGFFNKIQMEKAQAGRKGHALLILQNQQAQITTAYNGNTAGYRGTTSGGTGKIGQEAYLADLAYVDKEIRRLLRYK